MLELRNISYYYNKDGFALNNINIKINRGSVACLLGPSGCGKSTILKLIAGIERPKSGFIAVNNKAVVNDHVFLPIEKRNIGLIFQHPTLFPHKTVIENITFAIKKCNKEEKYKIALEILDLVNMTSYKDLYPHMLSGGQQQLITIARTIAQKPEVVLLDEPFSNMDVILKRKIRKYMLSLFKERNIAALLVTHDPEEALEIADTIYIIRDGSVIQHGTPHDIYYNPKDYELAKFFGELNHFHAVAKKNYVESPFGKIPINSQNNNDKVIVCIRPEAILLQNNGGIQAIVDSVKFFNKMVYIKIKSYLCFMRFPIALLPNKGDIISIALDLDQVLVFKA
ncbi:ABC transporter ATP-binding protein [Candidatus Mesenet endosymbiont of Phosphuga atrata]|uniref:ABC transporter ATP-binding protein n=1 Tax=Candidatus Mesenet endosymbiont of Phosphuga atrata TaxID=3066221 RepID=UPI0030D23AE8